MPFEKPSWLTQHQIDVLMCIVPGPIGRGLTQRETARYLNVSVKAIEGTLSRFKERFPDAWERVESMRRAASRHRKKLSSPASFDLLSSYDEIGPEGFEMLIKESF
jgi:hypothetical protein